MKGELHLVGSLHHTHTHTFKWVYSRDLLQYPEEVVLQVLFSFGEKFIVNHHPLVVITEVEGGMSGQVGQVREHSYIVEVSLLYLFWGSHTYRHSVQDKLLHFVLNTSGPMF